MRQEHHRSHHHQKDEELSSEFVGQELVEKALEEKKEKEKLREMEEISFKAPVVVEEIHRFMVQKVPDRDLETERIIREMSEDPD